MDKGGRDIATTFKGGTLAIFFAAFSIGPIASSYAEEREVRNFGAWALRCESVVRPNLGRCALTQAVRSDDDPSSIIRVMIRRSSIVKNALLQVFAPENVLLPEGVKFKIDQTDIGQLPFFKCFRGDCAAQGIVDDELMEKLENGRIGVLTIYFDPGKGLRHLLNLSGFKEGYDVLNKSER